MEVIAAGIVASSAPLMAAEPAAAPPAVFASQEIAAGTIDGDWTFRSITSLDLILPAPPDRLSAPSSRARVRADVDRGRASRAAALARKR